MTDATSFRCGHPRTEENSSKNGASLRCRQCRLVSDRQRKRRPPKKTPTKPTCRRCGEAKDPDAFPRGLRRGTVCTACREAERTAPRTKPTDEDRGPCTRSPSCRKRARHVGSCLKEDGTSAGSGGCPYRVASAGTKIPGASPVRCSPEVSTDRPPTCRAHSALISELLDARTAPEPRPERAPEKDWRVLERQHREWRYGPDPRPIPAVVA